MVVQREESQQQQRQALAQIPNTEEQVTGDEEYARHLQNQENRQTHPHFTWSNFFWNHKKAILASCLTFCVLGYLSYKIKNNKLN